MFFITFLCYKPNFEERPYDMDTTILRYEWSTLLDIQDFGTGGLGEGYALRRHKFEDLANQGSEEARQDWNRLVGPLQQFGAFNSVNGNFSAVVLPFCNARRLRLVSYVIEYAFLHDTVIESANDVARIESDSLYLEQGQSMSKSAVLGAKQMQAKMALLLSRTDPACAQRILKVWEEMVATTAKRNRQEQFSNIEEYIDYRIIDTGAPFVESLMLFGMGMTLTREEDDQLRPIIRDCYAALGLANDYFSYDRERAEADETGDQVTNAVELYMQWENTDVKTAKVRVKEETRRRESRYLHACEASKGSQKLNAYLEALSHQVSGNIVWSVNCPRYHPSERFRYDSRDWLKCDTDRSMNGDFQVVDQCRPSTESSYSEWSVSETTSTKERSSSCTSLSGHESSDQACSCKVPCPAVLTEDIVNDPINYISSLPSKRVRDQLIDSLNVWMKVPDNEVNTIKQVVSLLHNASLMFDDIEDNSDLRRGMPSTHKVFGTPTTINSASFGIIKALEVARSLNNDQSLNVFVEELKRLHIGQSYDLYWNRQGERPTTNEYMVMVDAKTSGLFRLSASLLASHTSQAMTSECRTKLGDVMTLFGRCFQIRDDYLNLKSEDYTDLKGSCQDLDEAKYSFPMIHALEHSPKQHQIIALLQQARESGFLAPQQKRLILDATEEAGSFKYTRKILDELNDAIAEGLEQTEMLMECKNWPLSWLAYKLRAL